MNFYFMEMSYYLIMEIKQTAINYIRNMNLNDKQKLKMMISHNVSCGRDYAIQNGIDPTIFNTELKNILEGK